mmetsp:Transcript_49058/g.116726  ORF Transcript_49058/g.116726 Transcript_49058/m.116726 type:complete len:243 (+) Transcript_49058:104-832(+)|eukprot:CAMPEP_0178403604 /NCGR_PEP_ID=MMETSP0689_2-20121128/17454_1 /TAXON_ID=160604 /ORGANISM="Amphidinium massartii, Strain CS-259" /LENGTH=242 /DNA_ID=CAMNT_0020024563 /DNA_START=105 /DNA_END=833 /DNA_ORIENTATION=-
MQLMSSDRSRVAAKLGLALMLTQCCGVAAELEEACHFMEHSLLAKATFLHRLSEKELPKEYLLDVDYLNDADNPLDNGEEVTPQSNTTGVNTTGSNEPSASPNASSPVFPGDLKPVALPRLCVTRAPPTEFVFYRTAAPGSKCIFGVDDRDEGGHCIIDDMAKTGSLGWCWTAEDRSEWGSCTEGCPLYGQEAALEDKIKEQWEEIDHWKEVIREKLADMLANTTNSSLNATNSSNSTPSLA